MRFFFTMSYYIVFFLSLKLIAIRTMEFKPKKKWLCFSIQLLLEIVPVIIQYCLGYYQTAQIQNYLFTKVNIGFYIADIIVLAFFAKGDFVLNAIQEFVFCQLWYLFLMVSCGVYVTMFQVDTKTLILCDSYQDINSLYSFIVCSVVVILMTIASWRILRLSLKTQWRALLVGIGLMIPFAINMISQGMNEETNQFVLNNRNALNTLALFLCLVICMIVLYYIYVRRSNREQKDMLDQSLKSGYEQYSKLTKIVVKNAKWRHDIANHISVIEQVSNAQHKELTQPVVEYTRGILQQSGSFSIAAYTGNEVLDCVLSMKSKLATVNGIATKMDVFFPQKADITDYELVGLVANLLDNAIEACAQVEQDKRFLHLHSNCISNYLCIELKNSKCGTLRTKEHGLVTTKKDKAQHGFGTELISEIVRKYEGKIHYVDEGDCLRTHIMIKIG